MGRVFRIWRGNWKKNDEDQWYFVPYHQDYGFTMYMDSPETLPVIEATVREYYMLSESTPVLMTYGMPNWMLFPTGPAPPVTLATTIDLVHLIMQRPPLSDITLLATLGAKNVAEFQFLSRSDFTVGSSTYVVGSGQDARDRERYEGLVLGERLVMSERLMSEIFGEDEMVILHRVALEIGYADRVMGRQAGGGGVQRMEIIQLDDDDEMVDVASSVGTDTAPVVVNEVAGAIVPFQPPTLPHVTAEEAPSVLWDVGLDLFDYPEFYNAQRDGRLVTADEAFWSGLIEENFQTVGAVSLINSQNQIAQNVEAISEGDPGEDGVVAQIANEAVLPEPEKGPDCMSGDTSVVCSQLAACMSGEDDGAEDIGVVGKEGKGKGMIDANGLGGVNLVGCSSEKGGGQGRPAVQNAASSSEGSEAEGDVYENGSDLHVGMMFRNRDAFKQHVAMVAIANKFCFRSTKSDPGMMILQCVSSSCPWRVYAIRLKDSDVFEVRKLVTVHTCSIADRGAYQSQATSAVIGELMKSKFAGNGIGPRPREIRLMMRGDHDVSISYWKAWKSRELAVDNGHGTCSASYLKLPSHLICKIAMIYNDSLPL